MAPDGTDAILGVEQGFTVKSLEPSQVVSVKQSHSPETVKETIRRVALAEGVPAKYLLAMAETESDFDPDRIGSVGECGVFQIRPYPYRDVTCQQAKDVDFATHWTARRMKGFASIEVGIKSHNGQGKKAERYLKSVLKKTAKYEP